jgi:hypothetical protein
MEPRRATAVVGGVTRRKKSMRTTFAALSFAALISLVCCPDASAVPASAPAMKEAAATASAMQRAQYYERHTRHGVVKCYREFVVGRYVCRRYGWW